MNFKQYVNKSLNESSSIIDLGVEPKQLQVLANKDKLIPNAKAEWEEIKSKVELKKAFIGKGNVVAVINPNGTLNLILKNPYDWDKNALVRLYIVDSSGKIVSSSKETIPKALSRAGKGKYYYTKASAKLSSSPESKENKKERELSEEFANKVIGLVEGKAKKLYKELSEEVKKQVVSSLDKMDFVSASKKLSTLVSTSARFMSTDPELVDFKTIYNGGVGFRMTIANILDKYSGSSRYAQDRALGNASKEEIREAAAFVLKEIKEQNERILNRLKDEEVDEDEF